MTNPMIRRVANYLMDKAFGMGLEMTDYEALEYAKEAIVAMREPTEAMERAGDDCDSPGSNAGCMLHWAAMIDEALKED